MLCGILAKHLPPGHSKKCALPIGNVMEGVRFVGSSGILR